MQLTDEDNGRTVKLPEGTQSITIRLLETPTSGYLWDVEQTPANVTVVSKNLEKSTAKAAGASGIRIFNFRPEAEPVTGTLKLRNCRPWDSNDVIASYTLTFE
ncbi:protease inhibitor I42 family protein [Tunicatimonas pelagia]|uniref:protease inhibitor I42 family protein n=1 Tax=Tunicatimonas pelagia TaxID=931531 RepID=UPI002666036B|nr:protease inhibitor I42 family protein [Tunicatimonas pelagia]WKN45011.1 protease inhibitor I42 family protein [Tunicatimonas pelagia]